MIVFRYYTLLFDNLSVAFFSVNTDCLLPLTLFVLYPVPTEEMTVLYE